MEIRRRDEIREIYMGALRDLLGDRAPSDILETADPLKDLGLDSADGVFFAGELSEKLGFRIPNDVNPLVDDVNHCGLRIGDSINLVCKLMEEIKT